MKFTLSEETVWNIGLSKKDFLEHLAGNTVDRFQLNERDKSKITPYVGTVNNDYFRIRENGSLTAFHSIGGTQNQTLIEGQIRELHGLTQIMIKASQLNLRTLFLLTTPFLLAFGLTSFVRESPYFLLGIPVAIIFDILVLNGLNSELNEALSKFHCKLQALEKHHHNIG